MSPLESRLGHVFARPELLTLALTHPSAVPEADPADHNQRLEFLGDTVLDLIVAEELYQRHPGYPEGALHPLKASLVSKEPLAALARELGLGAALHLGPGEAAHGGADRPGNLADALEAVIGAIYLDAGLETTRRLALAWLESRLAAEHADPLALNPKGRLQEILQAISPETPSYTITISEGPDHDPLHRAQVHWRGQLLGQGQGPRKRDAEAAAAREALEQERWVD